MTAKDVVSGNRKITLAEARRLAQIAVDGEREECAGIASAYLSGVLGSEARTARGAGHIDGEIYAAKIIRAAILARNRP